MTFIGRVCVETIPGEIPHGVKERKPFPPTGGGNVFRGGGNTDLGQKTGTILSLNVGTVGNRETPWGEKQGRE